MNDILCHKHQFGALAGDIVLCSWARHFSLTVPLSTEVYNWVLVNLMLGNKPAMDWHPFQGGVEILLVASCWWANWLIYRLNLFLAFSSLERPTPNLCMRGVYSRLHFHHRCQHTFASLWGAWLCFASLWRINSWRLHQTSWLFSAVTWCCATK